MTPQCLKIIPNVVDETFLPRHPQELLSSADFQPVPNSSVVNNDEYRWLNPSVRPSPNALGAGESIQLGGSQGFIALGPSYLQLETPQLPRA